MTKQQTLLLKGLALLMMFFVHINWTNYENLINIGGVPLMSYFAKLSAPVEIFTILGGYGLCYVYQNSDKNHYTRILRLYIHYWIIIVVFCSIGHFIEITGKYPGSLKDIILNVSSFHTTWNYECWFLFPYSLLSISYPMIFKFYDKINSILVFFVALLLFGISGYFISFYHVQYKESSPFLYNSLYVFFLLLPFTLGYLMKRMSFVEKMATFVQKRFVYKLIPILLILLCILIKLQMRTSSITPFYSLGIIVGFVMIIKSFQPFEFIGKHSMNMWMIHTWFIYYLFPSFFGGIKYSILLLAILLMVCIACSLLVNFIAKPLELKYCNGKR